MGLGGRLEMILTKTHGWIIIAIVMAAYWIPAFFWPEEVKSVVNAAFFFLSIMTALVLVPDVVDMVRTRATGMSWQAAMAKGGLFILFSFFAAARMWGFILGLMDFPEALLKSPVGGFLSLMQGIGMALVFFGFSSVGNAQPQVNLRGTALLSLAIGIVVGLCIRGLPL